MYRTLRLTIICLVACMASILGSGFTVRAEVSDMLERPAMESELVTRLVQLAVARAGSRLIAVGERGTILLSDDDGVSWRQAKSVPVSLTLTSVCFVNDSRGWAVGHSGIVMHTSDGGETWVKQFDGTQAARVEFSEAKAKEEEGNLSTERRLRQAERLVKDGPDKPFLSVWFSDEQHGVIVGGYGLAFATYDGGKTWQSLLGALHNPRGNHLYDVRLVGTEWYIVGEQGILFRSLDGGKTFVAIKTPYVGTYFGVVDGANGELVVFGLRGNAYWSDDNGVEWKQVITGTEASLTSGERLLNGNIILADETGQVLKSVNGGRTFDRVPIPLPQPFTGVVQASDGNLIASGARGITRIVASGSSQLRAKFEEGNP